MYFQMDFRVYYCAHVCLHEMSDLARAIQNLYFKKVVPRTLLRICTFNIKQSPE